MLGWFLLLVMLISFGVSSPARALDEPARLPATRPGFAEGSPYRLSLALDLPLVIGSVGILAAGFFWERTHENLDEAQVMALDRADVNAFDRPATDLYSEPAQRVSDVGQFLAFALPATLYASPEVRRDGWRFTALWGEVFLVTEGLTLFAKAAAARSRPYLYNDELTLEERTTGRLAETGRRSFFSGHASLSAAFFFYTAMAVETYHPASVWSRMTWVGGATLAALVASMRVVGGKHFPTDVLVGYAVGALVGVGIPLLHRVGREGRELAISPLFDATRAGLMARGRY